MKLFRKKKTHKEYYNDLGDDLFNVQNEAFSNEEKPLWFNLGYWEKATTYEQANKDYARLLATFGNFQRGDVILDVGFGFGVQDIFWLEEFNLKHITGINISDVQLEKAKQIAEKSGLSDQLDFQLGDATKLNFPEKTFDKVVALDCAYHFDSREDFFKQSYAVLKDEGKLVLSDYLPKKGARIGLFRKTLLSKVCIPTKNMYSIESYEEKLKKIGFKSIEKKSIGHFIFQGATKTALARRRGMKLEDIQVKVRPEDEKVFARNYRWIGMQEAYVIVAVK